MTGVSPTGEKTPRTGRFLLALALCALASLALGGAYLAPNHYPPWTSFHSEAAGFAALAFFSAARIAWPSPLVAARGVALAAAVVALIAIQWWAGQIAYGGDAFLSSLYVCGWALAWWLGANSRELGTRSEPWLWLAWIVIVSAALAVVIAHLQWLRMESTLGIFAAERGPDMRAYSNLGQPNHLASLMMMATALALLLHAGGRLGAIGCVVLVAWLSWGLTLSESRSGLLSAFCMGALVVGKGRGLAGLPRARWVAIWLAALTVLALAWPSINESLYLQSPRGALAARDSARQVIWKQCIAGIEQSPWVGYGFRQSMAGQKAGAASVDGWQASDYAHNVVLDLLLWVGVPFGLLLAGAATGWLARMLLRAEGATEVLLFASILPLAVHSMFEFPFAYSYFLFPAAWVLALLARMQRERIARQPPLPAPGAARWRVALAVAMFGVALSAVAHEYLLAEDDYRVMRFELRRVGRTPEGYEAPHLVLLTQLDEMLKLGRIVPRQHMPRAEIDRLHEGSVRFGWATLHLAYAMSLAMNGQPQQAQRELRLLHASYGDESYATAKQLWQGMQAQHPELAAVVP
ncbi:MAG TPA: Wzy polymerase domain-containing protein [Ramlibacter sp.]|nr:Wzy polymerase domain-containing protein [Ramlibacter sp.]